MILLVDLAGVLLDFRGIESTWQISEGTVSPAEFGMVLVEEPGSGPPVSGPNHSRAAAVVENDEARGIATRGQDQVAVTRSAVHTLDLDFLRHGQLAATSSTHARIPAGVAFAGMGFLALISRIAASCCFEVLVLLRTRE
jgi:hypothetical protein